MQLVGNCAMRSLIYPIYIIIRVLFDKNDAYLNYLIQIVRLYIIESNLKKIFDTKQLIFDDIISIKFFEDIINNQIDSYYLKEKTIYQKIVIRLQSGIKGILSNLIDNYRLINHNPASMDSVNDSANRSIDNDYSITCTDG